MARQYSPEQSALLKEAHRVAVERQRREELPARRLGVLMDLVRSEAFGFASDLVGEWDAEAEPSGKGGEP